MNLSYSKEIQNHYETNWQRRALMKRWNRGPLSDLSKDFCVLEFQPKQSQQTWIYATCAMSNHIDSEPIELFLYSPIQSELHVELLTVICHFHRNKSELGLADTINFGRPWLPESKCDFGLISAPYLEDPQLRSYHSDSLSSVVNFSWLIPITREERDYKVLHGVEALEKQFEIHNFNYVDPQRESII